VDVFDYNRRAWDREVERGNPWTVPVTSAQVEAARRGEWSVLLTPTKPVPREWFGALSGSDLLCLASGGGQQAPILAAAGARVTVLDNSPGQLARDREVAERDGLEIGLELGLMTDLSRFPDRSFDLIFHPVSNLFVPDVRPVWRECARVLRPGGALLAGIANPVLFLFDETLEARGEFVVRHALPYSDLTSLTPEELERRRAAEEPLSFGHTLGDLIGGQVEAGLALVAFYEDGWPDRPLARFTPLFFATRAIRTGSLTEPLRG
jgi:SAM-dependent methyltransferase